MSHENLRGPRENFHRWSPFVDRTEYTSTRKCEKCLMRKITHHQPMNRWTEWRRADGVEIVMSSGTPECQGAPYGVAPAISDGGLDAVRRDNDRRRNELRDRG